jgi:hypothetical protein
LEQCSKKPEDKGRKSMYHKFKSKLVPGLCNGKLSYGVELSVDCLCSFVISVQSLNEALIDKIIINDALVTNKLILTKKKIGSENLNSHKFRKNYSRRHFTSIVSFDPDDLTVVNIQMSYNDLSVLVYLILSCIVKIPYDPDLYHFDQECENFQGVDGQTICWYYR